MAKRSTGSGRTGTNPSRTKAKGTTRRVTTERGASRRAAAARGATKRQPGKVKLKARKAPGRAATGTTRTKPKTPARRPSKLGAVATALAGTVAGAVVAVRRKVSRRPAADAIVLLERDHRRIEDLLKRGGETTERAVERRQELLDTIRAELAAHEMIEEQLFYPALRHHPEARDVVLEGFEEHHAADVVIAELSQVSADNERWPAKFKVLQETIQHHIEEEEGEMFRTARAVLGRDELEALGKQMAALKAQSPRG